MPSNLRTLRWTASALAAALLLSACASDGPRGRRGSGPRSGAMQMPELGSQFGNVDFNTVYQRAMEAKSNGDCATALPLLQVLSRRGPGYEGAQHALGECLLESAGTSVTDQLEALMWLRRAAEGGRAEAQGHLALIYLQGPSTMQNRDQALFWYALYKTTIGRGRVGFVPLATTEETALEAAFNQNALDSVSDLVATWTPSPWIPPTEAMLSGAREDREGGTRERRNKRRIANGSGPLL